MYKYLIILILLLSASLRFYNLPNNFVFAGDEEHQAILAQTIVKHFHIIWIGVNAAHLGFYLGPYWVYFTSLWLWLSGGNPLITAYVAASFGVLTTFLIILVGANLFSKKVGLLAGLLYASLPLIVFFDQKYWNPTPLPALSLLLFLSLTNLKKNPKWLILFSICFGLIFHIHLSLLPILLVALFWIFKQKIKIPKNILLLSLILFVLTIFPLISFDYFHKGSNISTPLRLQQIQSAPENRVNPTHHFIALFQTLGRIWYLKPVTNNADEVIISCARSSRTDTLPILEKISSRFNPPIFLSLIGSFLLLVFLFSKQTWQKNTQTLLALFLTSIITGFLLFPGGAFEYYLLGTFPLLLFLPGILISFYPKFKNLILISVFLASVLGIYSVLTNNPQFGFAAKISLIRKISQVIDDQPFELKQTGICHFYEGWRYLFTLNGKIPERSDSDSGLGWLYQDQITQKPAKYTVHMSESRAPANFDPKNATIIKQGGFTAYILPE